MVLHASTPAGSNISKRHASTPAGSNLSKRRPTHAVAAEAGKPCPLITFDSTALFASTCSHGPPSDNTNSSRARRIYKRYALGGSERGAGMGACGVGEEGSKQGAVFAHHAYGADGVCQA
eukprot:COSAG05_NODE_6835_length_894_cov_1.166038_1_plen_120_part_00